MSRREPKTRSETRAGRAAGTVGQANSADRQLRRENELDLARVQLLYETFIVRFRRPWNDMCAQINQQSTNEPFYEMK